MRTILRNPNASATPATQQLKPIHVAGEGWSGTIFGGAALTNRPAWAHFDANWYARTYGQHLLDVAPTAAAIEAYYHTFGTTLRHSPNPFFDETWYLANNCDVAQAVEDGVFASGFEHYGLTGHQHRSPHWLFSEAHYLSENADLTADFLTAGHYSNGYDHYLRTGDLEYRSGHWLFDPNLHRAAAAYTDLKEATGIGEFARFITGDRTVGSSYRLSWYFDPIWYLATYPEVADEVHLGFYSCALEHYLCNPTPTDYDPNSRFSEEFYRKHHLDVRPFLENGGARNCFEHFLRYGAAERRQPHPSVDLDEYYRHVSVQTEIEQGLFADAFAHIESTNGQVRKAPAALSISEDDGKLLYTAACENLLPTLIRHQLDFTCGTPSISVIIVAHNRFVFTLATLASLRANYAGPMQVILVDSGSKDEIGQIERYVTGLDVVRFRYNVGFVDGCNAALQRVKASATLYLNNDVKLNPGAVQNALTRLWAGEATGAVGAKLIRTHGKLQEAGSIIWRDGWCTGYLRGQDPNIPEANFVRQVDFCSAAFLLCKTSVLRQMKGFDISYSPAYFEEADLAIRMREAGFGTIYDPTVSLQHYECATTGQTLSNRMMERSQPIFRRKNLEFLRRQHFNHPSLVTVARAVAPDQRRILFIEDRLPFRHLGSGFVRSNDVLHAMAELGYHVTLYPIYKAVETLGTIYKAFPDTVEVVHDRELSDLEAFIAERSNYYDAIWIARTHNAERLAPVLARCAAHLPANRVVLDTEAITSSRMAERDKLHRVPRNGTATPTLKEMVETELRCAFISQRIIAVNCLDAMMIEEAGFTDVQILGHTVSPIPAPTAWAPRHGLLFLASIPDEGSPNFDALSWFSSNVLPILDKRLPPDAVFTVAGYVNRHIDFSIFRRNRRVEMLGAVSDLDTLYDRYRVFVAPTRFASGIPYKLHEAAAHGLPIVASNLLIRQVGWVAGKDIALGNIDNPEQFAETVMELYDNERVWTDMQASSRARILAENGRQDYLQKISDILRSVFT